MRQYVHLENIKHFEGRLKTTTEEPRRQHLLQLLQEEKAQLLDAETNSADPLNKASPAE